MSYSFDHNAELVENLRNGDTRCFNFIFNGLFDAVTAFAFGYTRDQSLAQDISQHSFMKLWEKRKQLDPSSSVKNLLFTIARNRYIDLYRKGKKHVLLQDMLYLETVIEIEENSEDNTNEYLRKLDIAIEDLPKKCKEVFVLKRRDNLKNQEIAEYLGISLKTVEDHISRALRLLRRQMLIGLFMKIVIDYF